jgi:hypothetical protein
MTRLTLCGIASALLLPISLPAQSAQGPIPLVLTVTPAETQMVDVKTHLPTSVPSVAVDIRNASEKRVLAISLTMEHRNAEGKVVATGGATFFRQHNGEFNCLAPGQAFSSRNLGSATDASGNSSKTTISLDSVIFDDGSEWGPGNDAEQKGFLLGKYEAYKQIQSQTGQRHCEESAPRPAP